MRAVLSALLLCLFIGLPGPAAAQDPYALGVEAFRRGDYETAARHYMSAAAQGDGRAMNGLGFLFDNGWGVIRNGAQAQEFYIAAAGQGSVMASNNLAYLWARQNGLLPQALCLSALTLEQDPDNAFYLDTYGFILLQMDRPAEAEAYFRKAIGIAPDYSDPHEHMGDVMALTGRGEARDWWRRALANPRDDRQKARLAAKLGGAPPPGDINAHPPFTLRNPGLPAQCGVPSV